MIKFNKDFLKTWGATTIVTAIGFALMVLLATLFEKNVIQVYADPEDVHAIKLCIAVFFILVTTFIIAKSLNKHL